MTPENDVLQGDCVEVMAGFDADSIDAIVCDPPYDLLTTSRKGSRRINNPDTPAGRTARGFMGKTWDGTGVAFDPATWAAALRAAKPGAHLLAFGGTRTYHRLATAIEDAGWEIRDCLVWAYASGFPKSLNFPDGFGTALKPAWEPIVMARKPLRSTVAANREAHGTGALNIAASRIPGAEDGSRNRPPSRLGSDTMYAQDEWTRNAIVERQDTTGLGRWPANVILTDPIFDGDTPGVVGGGETKGAVSNSAPNGKDHGIFGAYQPTPLAQSYGDSGTYSRFFLIPKADRSDREPVMGGLPMTRSAQLVTSGEHRMGRSAEEGAHSRQPTTRANHHPTVKPTELMRHLVRLVTPPGGLVLDPFLGSGTTALAAEMEGFRWLGIEKEPEYVAIARARLLGTQRGLGLTA